MRTLFDPIRTSIWRSHVNTLLGIIFLGVCALWASVVIWQAATGENAIVTAFAAVVEKSTTLSN